MKTMAMWIEEREGKERAEQVQEKEKERKIACLI